MKKLILTAVISANFVMAQEIKVKESSGSFSSGSAPCLETKIYNANINDVKDKWKNILKDFKNEKVKTSGNEVIGDNILIKDWGNNPVDIYTTFEEKSDKTIEMKVAVDLGNGNFLKGGDKDKVRYIEKMMKDFAIKASTEPLEKQIKEQNIIVAEIESTQKSLEKKNENLKKDIENYKEKIKKAEEEIKNNESELEKKKQELANQQKTLDELKKKLSSIK
jgi:DNA repair exonuclease SbcCD ATPase subunit